MLRHHESVNAPTGGQASEDDIRRSIADLLVGGGLVEPDEVRLEAERNDIRTGDLIIEVKRRIGAGIEPDPRHVAQLDGYLLRARGSGGPDRLGILTDGKHWVLRRRGCPQARTDPSRAFTLLSAEAVGDLVEWLVHRTQAVPGADASPTPAAVAVAFGTSASAETFVSDLAALHDLHRSDPTVAVKRDLWRNLLAAALGEVIDDEVDLDGLFVRHTYLSSTVALAVQAAFGVDVCARHPGDLISGAAFVGQVGVRGVIESDFFGWPVETDAGREWVAALARRVAAFDWTGADYDMARVLYQTVMGAEERRRLGEYYTPDWLASAVVGEVVDDPLAQRVLDPACGSGAFLRAAIRLHIEAAERAGLSPGEIVSGLRERVVGIDIHPVAVHLARATWVLAARRVIAEADDVASLTVPVYLGDSLQLLTDPGSLFGSSDVTVEIRPFDEGGPHRFLHFPKALVARGDWFDAVMLKAAADIEAGLDASITLDDAQIADGGQRRTLEATLRTMAELHAEGRDHIWAYYTRNLMRPAWLSEREGQVDRIVGNPPWLTLSRSESTVRRELEGKSRSLYKTWVGGRFAPHQDVAGLFFARSVDLYLREGGRCGMVMPHSALISGQYSKWRTGDWGSTGADLGAEPWDLERIEPNTFFPIAASVVFARKSGGSPAPLPAAAQQWHGPEGGPNTLERVGLASSFSGPVSPYGERAAQGAIIVPRLLFFVEAADSTISLEKGVAVVRPMRSNNEKPPWKDLNPPELSDALEWSHIHPVHRGDTVAPFVLLEPHHAALPLRRGDAQAPWPGPARTAIAGVDPAGLGDRMRRRWRAMDSIWNENKRSATRLSLIEQIDYFGKLSRQTVRHPIRVVYTRAGRPTAALLTDDAPLLDSSLYWVDCGTLAEACYLLAVINSDALYRAVEPLMPKGQFGARDLCKHLWKLPIPLHDPDELLHRELAAAGSRLADSAVEVLRASSSDAGAISTRWARRVLREWLATSELAARVDGAVESLLSQHG